MNNKPTRSIFTGVEEDVNEFFEVPLYPSKRDKGKLLSYVHKEFLQLFFRGGRELNFLELMEKIDRRIRDNMTGVVRSHSDQNWRFEQYPDTKPDPTRPGKEVIWVRNIVKHVRSPRSPDDEFNWFNHVPVCAGLCGGANDNQRAVDLIERCPDGYTFYEVKVSGGAGAPLHAAIELIGYALTYLIFREDKTLWGKESCEGLLTSPRIRLRVLAPKSYYREWLEHYEQPLQKFAKQFSAGIENFAAKRGVDMNFAFASLGNDFEPDIENDPDAVRNAIEQITVIGQARR